MNGQPHYNAYFGPANMFQFHTQASEMSNTAINLTISFFIAVFLQQQQMLPSVIMNKCW